MASKGFRSVTSEVVLKGKGIDSDSDQQQQKYSLESSSPFSVSISDGAPLTDSSAAPKRHFVFSGVVKSLRDFDRYEAPSPLSMFTTQHRSRETPVGSERQGDPTQAVIKRMTVLEAWNFTPTGLYVSSPELSRGRIYGPGDRRAFMFLPPNMPPTVMNKDVMIPPASLYSDVASSYAGLEPNKELSEEMRKLIDADVCLVKKGTAHHQLLINNEAKNTYRLSDMDWDFNSGYVVVSKKLYGMLEDYFQTKIAKACPTVDMLSSKVVFEPEDHIQHFASLDEMSSLPYSFGCVIEIEYRFKK